MCREQAAEFRPHEQDLKASGVGLVFVSTGTPSMARDFQEKNGLASPIWVDRTRETYRHLGFKRSVFATLFSPKALRNTARAWKAGHRQGGTRGDPWQQGGVIVVKRGGQPVFGYAAAEAGDHPPTSEVIAAARRAAA